MKRTLAATSMLAVAILTGCGGSDTEAYCSELEEQRSAVQRLTEGSIDEGFAEAARAIGRLADAAPEEVEDEWRTLTGVLGDADDVESALENLQELGENIDTAELERAAEEIQRHAREECGIDFQG